MNYDLLIRGGQLLTGEVTDVAITGHRIVAMGASLPGTASKTIDATGKWLSPPFYNCHTHVPMTLFRGYADDLELFDWLTNHIFPAEARLTPEDIYHGTRLACLEMIKSGTVFFNDSYFALLDCIKATEELGMRACIGLTWTNTGNADFCAKLTAEHDEVLRQYRSGAFSSRIQLAFAPHAIYTVPEADLRTFAQRAEDENMLVHMHLAETPKEFEDCKAQHGGLTPVEYMQEVGLLNSRARFAHCVHFTDRDIELFSASQAVAITNPTSNLKLNSGIARLQDMDDAGCRLALGTDGCASNNSHSFFSEMKIASLSAKCKSNRPTAGTAERIFKMATADGAAAFVPEAGAIETGRLADLIIINPQQPYLVGDYNPISNLVYAAESSCVQTVICDGRLLMEDRVVPNEAEILAAARKTCDKFGNVRNLGVGYENSGESAFILPSNLIQKRGTKVSVILFQQASHSLGWVNLFRMILDIFSAPLGDHP